MALICGTTWWVASRHHADEITAGLEREARLAAEVARLERELENLRRSAPTPSRGPLPADPARAGMGE